MKELLRVVTEHLMVVIDALALVMVAIGTAQAFVSSLNVMLSSRPRHEPRYVWLRYARWLVAGLTMQLASDIIESSITQSWRAVGRLAAIAVIRTFLNFFLERDVAEARQSERAAGT